MADQRSTKNSNEMTLFSLIAADANHDERVAWLKKELGLPPQSAPTLDLLPVGAVDTATKRIYLDHGHWIEMSRVRAGKTVPLESRACYEALATAVGDGTATVFLTETSYIENQVASSNVNHRTLIANVMSELTRFASIGSRAKILEGQFAHALHELTGRPVWPKKPEVYGRGYFWAFNGIPNPANVSSLLDVVSKTGNDEVFLAGLTERVHELSEMIEYAFLRGAVTFSGELEQIYQVASIAKMIEERADADNYTQNQIALSADLKLRVDDPICASIFVNEFGRDLPRLLSMGGTNFHSFFARPKSEILDFLHAMPSIAVEIAIRRQSALNASRPWTSNDTRDVHHHSMSIPYCDAVLADSAVVDALSRTSILEELNTVVFARPRGLAEWLSN
jgi:hypothetical protein